MTKFLYSMCFFAAAAVVLTSVPRAEAQTAPLNPNWTSTELFQYCTLSPDGNYVAAKKLGKTADTLFILNANDGSTLKKYPIVSIADDCSFSSDSRYVFTLGVNYAKQLELVSKINIETNRRDTLPLNLSSNDVISEVFPTSDPGQFFGIIQTFPSFTGSCIKYSMSSHGIASTLQLNTSKNIHFWHSPDLKYYGMMMNSGSKDYACIISAQTMASVWKAAEGSQFGSLNFSNDGKYCAFNYSGTGNKGTSVLNTSNFSLKVALPAGNQFCFSHGSKYLNIYTSPGPNGYPFVCNMYDVETGAPVKSMPMMKAFKTDHHMFSNEAKQRIVGLSTSGEVLCFSYATTGIDELQPSFTGVSARPNPANESINVEWQESARSTAVLEVTDARGIGVLGVKDINCPEGTNSLRLETSTLPPGVYFLRLISADGTLRATKFSVAR